MNAFISIIIPVYNAEKYLEECVGSIVRSEVFNELEVVLVNDGSVDRSALICDRFGSEHENIKVLHKENGGVSKARNAGIETATGEYLTFCDADDYYLNDVFKNILSVLKNNNADLLFYDFLYEQIDCTNRISYPFEKRTVFANIPLIFEYMLGNESLNSSWNKVFKRSVIVDNDISFNQGQRYGEDRDFVLAFLTKAKTSYYLPEEGYFYRYVKTGAVHKARTDYFDNIYQELLFKKEISKSFDIDKKIIEKVLYGRTTDSIISAVFASSENRYPMFKASLNSLFSNEALMKILFAEKEKGFTNPAYKKVHEYLMSKNILKCRIYIELLKLKEKVYKMIH